MRTDNFTYLPAEYALVLLRYFSQFRDDGTWVRKHDARPVPMAYDPGGAKLREHVGERLADIGIMAEPKFRRGDRVRLSAEGRELGIRKGKQDDLGTVRQTPMAELVFIVWDRTVSAQIYHVDLIERAGEPST